jgi:hypothetical protein
MAELLILEFDGVTESDYRNVSAQLGIDLDTGQGDWPPGLISHLAGMSEDGHGVIVESGPLVKHRQSSWRTDLERRRPEAGSPPSRRSLGRTSSGSTTQADKH